MAAVAKKPSLAAPKIDPVSNSIFEKKSMQFFYFLQRSLKYFQSPHNDCILFSSVVIFIS